MYILLILFLKLTRFGIIITSLGSKLYRSCRIRFCIINSPCYNKNIVDIANMGDYYYLLLLLFPRSLGVSNCQIAQTNTIFTQHTYHIYHCNSMATTLQIRGTYIYTDIIHTTLSSILSGGKARKRL